MPRLTQRLTPEGAIELIESFAAVMNDGSPCLVLRGPKPLLERVRSSHEAVAAHGPAPFPRCVDAVDEAEGVSWLAFRSDPVGTLEDLAQRCALRSIPYVEAIALTRVVAEGMRAAHSAGQCLGAVSASQIIVERDGSLSLLGLGFDDAAWGPRAVRAPVVAMGGAPTFESDVNAGLLFLRTLIHFVREVPSPLAALLRGEAGPVARAFGPALLSILSQTSNIDGPQALLLLERFWAFIGVTPDQEGLARRLRDAYVKEPHVTIGPEFTWISVNGGPRHDLVRREPVRRVFRTLVEAEGAPMSAAAIVEGAWPGEALVKTSGADRVYVALSTLRKLDLREAIIKEGRGYVLRARTSFQDV